MTKGRVCAGIKKNHTHYLIKSKRVKVSKAKEENAPSFPDTACVKW